MIAIKVKRTGKQDRIAHIKNETNCKKWLSLLHGDFESIEIRNMKTKSVAILYSQFELDNFISK